MKLNTLPLKPASVCGPNCAPAIHTTHASFVDQVKEFVLKLFSTADWPPRWICGTWSDFHGWLYIFSDLLIWACYFAIPVILISLLRKRKDIPYPKVVKLFIVFILFCGATHLLDAVMFWWPAYRLSALLRLITGIVSVATVVALIKVLPRIHSLRTITDLEDEINERKDLEKRLARSEFMLTEAGRMGKMGAWEIDLKTFEAVWSRMIYDIYELPYDYDTSLHDIDDYFLAPYNEILKSVIDRAVAEGTPWDIDLQVLTAKKNLKWVRSYGEPLYDRAGEVYKLRGVFVDIDRFKNTELSLNKSMDMVSQNNRHLKSFTHILSHNIRNHANNMAMASSLVNVDTLDEHNKELFEQIQKVSEGLKTTLTDLSDAIKIRENSITSERVSFEEVTTHALKTIDAEVKASNAIIDFDFAVDHIDFPKEFLESIISNLVTNAITYRKPDVAPHIVLKTYINNKHRVVFECNDNGTGIDLEVHGPKVFGLYKTFHNNAPTNGVGLFLSKIQIESQGGSIEVESKPGVGSTFKVIFSEVV